MCVCDCLWLSMIANRLFSITWSETFVYLNLLLWLKCEFLWFVPFASAILFHYGKWQHRQLSSYDGRTLDFIAKIHQIHTHFHMETEFHLANSQSNKRKFIFQNVTKNRQTQIEYRFFRSFPFLARLAFRFILHPFPLFWIIHFIDKVLLLRACVCAAHCVPNRQFYYSICVKSFGRMRFASQAFHIVNDSTYTRFSFHHCVVMSLCSRCLVGRFFFLQYSCVLFNSGYSYLNRMFLYCFLFGRKKFENRKIRKIILHVLVSWVKTYRKKKLLTRKKPKNKHDFSMTTRRENKCMLKKVMCFSCLIIFCRNGM